MNKRALIVGGGNGIGLAMVQRLLKENYQKIVVADISAPELQDTRVEYIKTDLTFFDESVFLDNKDVDTLIITAGLGRASEFKTFSGKEIEKNFRINSESVIKILNIFYDRLLSRTSCYGDYGYCFLCNHCFSCF